MVKAACLNPTLNRLMLALSQSILRHGFGRPVQKGAQRRVSGIFVLALWRAVRGRASALPGTFPRSTNLRTARHLFCLVAAVANSNLRKEFHHV